jgi:hypothetical protein
MFEFGWAQWAQVVDWLADGGLRNFILDFFQLGAFRTIVWMMIGAILARYATRLWFRFVHPRRAQRQQANHGFRYRQALRGGLLAQTGRRRSRAQAT